MNHSNATMRKLLEAFPGKRVVVVGDIMLDEYVWGSVRRISPEAPVPVVEVQRREFVPGGAANTAVNVAGLSGQAMMFGIVGQDEAGMRVQEALHTNGVNTDGILVDNCRPTVTKTRIVAHSQQVVRVDHEQRTPLSRILEDALLEKITAGLEVADVCILSDYAKGLVSAHFAQELIGRACRFSKPVVVDPKGIDFSKYRGAQVIKPNLHEVSQVLSWELDGPDRLLAAGRRLLEILQGGAVLITQGAEGMSLFMPGAEAVHIPTEAREVYDVTGAGDTVASTLAMALAVGAQLEQAAWLASCAAGIVISKVGTASVSLDDLFRLFRRPTTPSRHHGYARDKSHLGAKSL